MPSFFACSVVNPTKKVDISWKKVYNGIRYGYNVMDIGEEFIRF